MKRKMGRGLALLLVGMLTLAACSSDDVTAEPVDPPATEDAPTEPAPEPVPEPLPPTSLLTGEPVSDEVRARPVMIVKVENSPQARPQSGLDRADVVFEEVVEGGVTRFFTVFQSELPEIVGPVRSARPVDLDLMGIYGQAVFAFSGARGEVQQLLATAQATRITEGFTGFFRDGQRRAPHNLYLDTAAALDAAATRDIGPPPEQTWVFDDIAPAGQLTCPAVAPGTPTECSDPGMAITIRMARGGYVTNWTYDTPAGVYRRAQGSTPFLVTGDGQIGAANVVVLATRHYIGQSGYPETDVTTNSAPAVILRDGLRYNATWRKPSVNAPLELFTTSGDPFPLKPGPTWLHLPPDALLPTVGE